jgi:hypothetical protein
MAYVVIRRFRSGDGPTSARVYGEIGPAREVADAWYHQGWEVELVSDGRRGVPRKRPEPVEGYPPHRH